jgi:hypothetical protein
MRCPALKQVLVTVLRHPAGAGEMGLPGARRLRERAGSGTTEDRFISWNYPDGHSVHASLKDQA